MLKLEGYPRIIVGIVVASTASTVVGSLIAANTPPALTIPEKVSVRIGGYGLGLAAGAIAARYTLENIDDVLNAVNAIVAVAKAKK